jgi:uncharacterized membrane protein YkoI
MKTLVFTLLLLLSMPGWADEMDHDEALRLKKSGDILPLETLLEKARQVHDGKVIEVELDKEHGTLVYEIEILDKEGVLWEMKINATDGKILSAKEED